MNVSSQGQAPRIPQAPASPRPYIVWEGPGGCSGRPCGHPPSLPVPTCQHTHRQPTRILAQASCVDSVPRRSLINIEPRY